MRLRLVGYSGVRPPVPGTEVVLPEDPPPTTDPPPAEIPAPLVLVLNDGDEFHKGDYLALGYNRFDVMCIGGGGGRAGWFRQLWSDLATAHSDGAHGDLAFLSNKYGFGGAGGGGGVHRVKGRLALLPSTCPVVVGQGGADGGFVQEVAPGHDWRSGGVNYPNPAIPPGGDGGVSSFGGTICRASGGKGGSGLNGGAGGIGNHDGAGGGLGTSWQQGTFNPVTGQNFGAHMNFGAWDGKIGAGGAGGNGSVIKAYGLYPTGGARLGSDGAGAHGGYSSEADGAAGSVSTKEPSVSGAGEPGTGFGFDYDRVAQEIIYPTDGGNPYASGYNYISHEHWDVAVARPGFGGGARAFPINGDLTTEYGTKARGHDGKGLVIIRLTYAIV